MYKKYNTVNDMVKMAVTIISILIIILFLYTWNEHNNETLILFALGFLGIYLGTLDFFQSIIVTDTKVERKYGILSIKNLFATHSLDFTEIVRVDWPDVPFYPYGRTLKYNSFHILSSDKQIDIIPSLYKKEDIRELLKIITEKAPNAQLDERSIAVRDGTGENEFFI